MKYIILTWILIWEILAVLFEESSKTISHFKSKNLFSKINLVKPSGLSLFKGVLFSITLLTIIEGSDSFDGIVLCKYSIALFILFVSVQSLNINDFSIVDYNNYLY